MSANTEKILVYLGPSCSYKHASEFCPEGIYRRPACQGDLMSDAVQVQPDRILLIDGQFAQNLSVWHKEVIFCLTRGIKVYGASSMGALRAADLWRQGMIGCGKIVDWYRTGVTEDDAEVALLYLENPPGTFVPLSVPQINVRATLAQYQEILQFLPEHIEQLLVASNELGWRHRTRSALIEAWEEIIGVETCEFLVNNLIDQKYLDACELLRTFRTLEPDPLAQVPGDSALSKYFWAAYDRDRKIQIPLENGLQARTAQAHIDGYIALHAVDYPQIFWDAKNFYLANMLAEKLGVRVTEAEVAREWNRFIARHSIGPMQLGQWIERNALTEGEAQILLIRMATVRKLHEWLASTMVPMEMTKITLDYLKSHDAYLYWAREAGAFEDRLAHKHIDESLSASAALSADERLAQHAARAGITIDGSVDEYIYETGFNTRGDLGVALDRISALEREEHNNG